MSGPEVEQKEKELVKIFKKIGLSINVKTNLKTAYFLDIHFDLRYYATFKARKFESLICKINTCLEKNYQLHWIAGRGNIPCKYLIYIYIYIYICSNLGMAFAALFLCYF